MPNCAELSHKRPRFFGQIKRTKLKPRVARQGVVSPEPEARSRDAQSTSAACRAREIRFDPQHGHLPPCLTVPNEKFPGSNHRKTCPPVTVRSNRDGLDLDEVGVACNHRRSVGSTRCASPGRRMDSTAWRNGYVRQVTVRSSRYGCGAWPTGRWRCRRPAPVDVLHREGARTGSTRRSTMLARLPQRRYTGTTERLLRQRPAWSSGFRFN